MSTEKPANAAPCVFFFPGKKLFPSFHFSAELLIVYPPSFLRFIVTSRIAKRRFNK